MELIPNTTYYTDEDFAIVISQKLVDSNLKDFVYLGLVFEEEEDKKYIMPVLVSSEGLVISGDYGTIMEKVN